MKTNTMLNIEILSPYKVQVQVIGKKAKKIVKLCGDFFIFKGKAYDIETEFTETGTDEEETDISN